jgi:hypothetical protein
MKVKAFTICCAFALGLLTSHVEAADFYGQRGSHASRHFCPAVETAQYLLSLDRPSLRAEVARRYEEAIEVFNQPSTVFSTSPLFEWANQTKIACAKAIGYLRWHYVWLPEIDEESVQQCECFYDRMMAVLGHYRASRY